MRKHAIVEECKSHIFKDRCDKLSEAWAFEANAVLCPLMDKFKDDESNAFDERIALRELQMLLCDMLHLHARFEAETSSVNYFWPSPGEHFDKLKHDGYFEKGVIQYTNRFGVKFREDDGKEIVLLKACVQTIPEAGVLQ